MTFPKNLLKQFAIGCVALVAFCVVTLTGLSNYFRESDPARAVSLNPFNVEARINLVARAMSDPDTKDAVLQFGGFAASTISYGAIDAQAFGQLGDLYFRGGDMINSAQFFDIALGLSQTEPLALQRTFLSSIDAGDFSTAMDKLNILLRRWPQHFNRFRRFIPILLQQPSGYQQALLLIKAKPLWRRQFLTFLSRDAATAEIAYHLQLDLSSEGSSANQIEVATTIAGLLQAKKYYLAYRLFLLTQNEEDRRNNGYIFNGSFFLMPTGRPFDWTLRNQPGASITRKSVGKPGGQEVSLFVQFLDKPIKRIGLNQYVYLPVGQYRLSVDFSGSRLRAPKGLFWSLDCFNGEDGIARLEIPDGNHNRRTLETEFSIADGMCELLDLRLDTDLVAESFRYSYSGKLQIHKVSISRLGQ